MCFFSFSPERLFSFCHTSQLRNSCTVFQNFPFQMPKFTSHSELHIPYAPLCVCHHTFYLSPNNPYLSQPTFPFCLLPTESIHEHYMQAMKPFFIACFKKGVILTWLFWSLTFCRYLGQYGAGGIHTTFKERSASVSSSAVLVSVGKLPQDSNT